MFNHSIWNLHLHTYIHKIQRNLNPDEHLQTILSYIKMISSIITVSRNYLDHWNRATPRWRRDYWLSRVLVTSEMDNKGLPASGLESEGQLDPFPPLMIPPRADVESDGAEDGTRRCCCWCCCPGRCPCRFLSPFPQLTAVCCNRKSVFPRYLQPLSDLHVASALFNT